MERHVLVTGAGSGIGLRTALDLAGLGFTASGLVPDEAEGEQLAAARWAGGRPRRRRRPRRR